MLIDTSPCNLRTVHSLPPDSPLRLYEPFGFIEAFLLERLEIAPLDETVMILLTCSSRRKGLEPTVMSRLLAIISPSISEKRLSITPAGNERR